MRRGLTLVELLVVLAIATLLAAVLLPVLGRVRAQGRKAACIENLHQLGLAFNMYQADNNDGLPLYLSVAYPQYIPHPGLLICPNDAQQAQYPGNDRLEGTSHLASGVSYEYFPQWDEAQAAQWYAPAPDFGRGKWDDMTPFIGCCWHWASGFTLASSGDAPGSRGWELVLTRGGSVRRIRVEDSPADFTPAKLVG